MAREIHKSMQTRDTDSRNNWNNEEQVYSKSYGMFWNIREFRIVMELRRAPALQVALQVARASTSVYRFDVHRSLLSNDIGTQFKQPYHHEVLSDSPFIHGHTHTYILTYIQMQCYTIDTHIHHACTMHAHNYQHTPTHTSNTAEDANSVVTSHTDTNVPYCCLMCFCLYVSLFDRCG